jgi:hypothetical protein
MQQFAEEHPVILCLLGEWADIHVERLLCLITSKPQLLKPSAQM